MRKVIGIVGEGPIDQMVLKAAINRITGERHIYRNIQPEQDMMGEFGNGWKGVYRWCETNAELITALFSAISPALDLLIVQMDGDVGRKEKEVHCHCDSTVCPDKNSKAPLMCKRVKAGNCPVSLPCKAHDNSPEGNRRHLEELLRSLMGNCAEEQKEYFTGPLANNVFQCSPMPWVTYTHISHTNSGKRDNATPLIDWGRYYEKNGRTLMPVSIQAHHSFVDGIHIGQFADMLQSYLDSFA